MFPFVGISLESSTSKHTVSPALPKFLKYHLVGSDGYFCCTIGNASQETTRSYIASQG